MGKNTLNVMKCMCKCVITKTPCTHEEQPLLHNCVLSTILLEYRQTRKLP